MELTVVDHQASLLWQLLFNYMPPVILLIGTFGNTFCFIIFIKMSIKPRQYSITLNNNNGVLTVYLYLSMLAIFDTCVLLSGLGNEWISHTFNFNLKDSSEIMCKSLTYLGFFFSHCSSFIVVLITGLRFLAIYSPLQATRFTNKKKVACICSALISTAAILNAPYLWMMNLNPENNDEIFHLLNELSKDTNINKLDLLVSLNMTSEAKCSMFKEHSKATWAIIDQMVYCVIPFILILVFITQIIRNMRKYDHVKYSDTIRVIFSNRASSNVCKPLKIKVNNILILNRVRFELI